MITKMKSSSFCKVSNIISAVKESWGDKEKMKIGKTYTKTVPRMMVRATIWNAAYV